MVLLNVKNRFFKRQTCGRAEKTGQQPSLAGNVATRREFEEGAGKKPLLIEQQQKGTAGAGPLARKSRPKKRRCSA